MTKRFVVTIILTSSMLPACVPEFVRVSRGDAAVDEPSGADVDSSPADASGRVEAGTDGCDGAVPCEGPRDAPADLPAGTCDVGTRCGDVCVDLQRDVNHCGTCGRRCAVLCVAGACVGAAQIVGAQTGTCARMEDGTVWSWALGATRATRSSITDATDIAMGPFGVCAIVGSGEVQCTGSAGPSAPIRNARRVGCGDGHCCALLAEGTVTCWGDNSVGQLGTGHMEPRATPVLVPGVQSAFELVTNAVDTCVLYGASRATCWGGAAGLNPTPAAGLGGATSIFGGAGGENSWCGVFNPAREVWCGRSDSVAQVPGLTGVVSVSIGAVGRCAVAASGATRCWGGNLHGFLGNGGTADSVVPLPVPVSGLTDAVAVTSGYLHSCAIRRNGSVVCWGAGRRLPDMTLEAIRTPVPVLFE